MADIVTGRKRSPQLDMTPMVDLAFLLLTFFMLTTGITASKSDRHFRRNDDHRSKPVLPGRRHIRGH